MMRRVGLALVVFFLVFSPVAAGATAPQLTVLSGGAQVLLEGNRSAPVVLQVLDAASAPVAGERLNLLVGHCPTKAVDFRFDPPVLVTDAQGQASLTVQVSHAGEYDLLVQLNADAAQVAKVQFVVHDTAWVMFLLFGLAGGLGRGQQVTLNPGSRWRKWTRHLAASQRLEAAATLGNHNAGKISSFRFWRLLLATAWACSCSA